MRVPTLSVLLTTLHLLALSLAQNPFNMDPFPSSIPVGSPFTITWAPSTGQIDTVNLLLRQGDPAHLTTILTIAANITNTGSYIWTPPTSLVNGDQYTFEIIFNGNTDIVNYSQQFSITSSTTESSSPAAAESTASPSSGAGSAATTTASGTKGSATGAGTGAGTGGGSGSKTATGTASGTSTSASSAPSGNAAAGNGALRGISVGLLVTVGGIMAAL